MKDEFFNTGSEVATEHLEAVIEKLNVKLPQEYKDFIINVNGGEPKNNFLELRKFDPQGTNTNFYVEIDSFYHLDQLEEVWNYVQEDFNDLQLFPIAEVQGRMQICCKQADSKEAEIVFYDYNFGVIALTGNLYEFLKALIPKDQVNYKKYGFDFTFPGE